MELMSRFNLRGKDSHVDNGIAVIHKYISDYDILFDDEMWLAIIFHHGGWAKYTPNRINALGSLLHSADMMASQVLKI
jgi:hypothetical protein